MCRASHPVHAAARRDAHSTMTPHDEQTGPGDAARRSALDILLRRMQAESDFPALSEAIGDINRIASSAREGDNELSNHILKDFALTNKLLKLAYVAFFIQVGGGSISTISRAVVVLGFVAVRSIALSLILFDFLEFLAHAPCFPGYRTGSGSE